jgi:CDP-diacylglycerol--glycerol-3-phosphate 3-phosphatidyltransferase
VIPASRGGKAKTIAQMIAITLYVVPVYIPVVAPLAMAIAVALTVITGIDYIARAVTLRRRGRAAR